MKNLMNKNEFIPLEALLFPILMHFRHVLYNSSSVMFSVFLLAFDIAMTMMTDNLYRTGYFKRNVTNMTSLIIDSI